MGAFGCFAIVQPLNVSVDMCFSFFSIKELLHLCGSWECIIPQTERAILRAGESSAVNKRIALNEKRFRPLQVILTVKVSLILAENSFTAVEAQLNKAAGDHEFLFVAAVDVSSSLHHWFAIETEIGSVTFLIDE